MQRRDPLLPCSRENVHSMLNIGVKVEENCVLTLYILMYKFYLQKKRREWVKEVEQGAR
jgi:hypothetical protein